MSGFEGAKDEVEKEEEEELDSVEEEAAGFEDKEGTYWVVTETWPSGGCYAGYHFSELR